MSRVPKTFRSLSDLCPDIRLEMSYATSSNFTGEVVPGYKAVKAYLATQAAEALCLVQNDARKRGFCLKIFDAYRPVKAVAFFQEWAKLPETNLHLKELYYPLFTRQELFEQGYIARQSSHSRGSAVDLTLIDARSGEELDMGSAFDYFDDLSHTESARLNVEQLGYRRFLRELMEARGFRNFHQEWWHYSYRPEPFPNEYFDFNIE